MKNILLVFLLIGMVVSESVSEAFDVRSREWLICKGFMIGFAALLGLVILLFFN